ncbi:MAG: VWA domain-containing protein [Desulfobacteraceae bacterium]|nr:VWA domain-containing protein [Desulfobacteraceae bacterium]
MLKILTGFAACCRAFDLRVSTSEVLDAARHLELVDPLDPQEFKLAVRANFAKSRRDQSRFDYLFDLFFHGVRTDTDDSLAPEIGRITRALRQSKDLSDDPMEQALVDFLDNDPLAYIDQIHALHTMEERPQKIFKSNMGQLSSKLGVMLQINTVKSKIMALLDQGEHGEHGNAGAIREHFTERLDRAFALATEEPREHNDALKAKPQTAPGTNLLKDKPFSNLSPLEVAEMRALIERLVRKLKDQVSRRHAVKNRGVIDIKKTLRNSGKFQGVPLNIAFKNKPPRKSSIVALCDVSGSVWSGARFMLTLLYSLQECFARVKSFVFVADLVEVTELFQGLDINDAIEKALGDDTINRNAPTDYGSCFQQFKHDHMNDLNQKTTLIILGDGRSNYLNPQATILGEMRERCRRIIWLNPETVNTWTTGDSEISSYKTHCHEVRTCMNLNHLTEFIEELVL